MHNRRLIIQFIILCMVALLAGCSHVSRRDGPPDFYVDETKIPNAVPKVEPLSRIGNKPYYDVFGRRYYVMRSSAGYEERGIASWYGTRFHSHRTSNGERYNMLAMTAAHKSLPLPTYVLVTNLKNNKQVIVKVNDRGPFEANRLIDLSYVAAKKLGMLGHGTAYVDVKSIDPRDYQGHPEMFAKHRKPHPLYEPRQHQLASNSIYYLQVGAFHDRNHAIRLKQRLQKMVSAPVNVAYSGHLYRVHIGPIRDVVAAGRLSKHLRAAGLKNTVV